MINGNGAVVSGQRPSFSSYEAFQAGMSEAGLALQAFTDSLISLGSSSQNMQEKIPESLAVDLWAAMIYAVGIFLVTWAFRKAFVEPFAYNVVFSHVKAKKRRRMFAQKFAHSWLEVVVYGMFFVFGVVILMAQPWSWPSELWWKGFHTASPSPHATIRMDLKCFYLLYGARYAACGISVLIETKRKDFIEMQIHHWVTVGLVSLSYATGWNRVGCVVMMLLDPADVPLHSAKMFKYIADSKASRASACLFMADRFFEVFAVVFFITRLVMYPYVCWSALFETLKVWSDDAGAPWAHDFKEWLAIILLLIILALQCYWFCLIVQVAVKLFMTGEAEDVRSDDETNENAEEETENQKEVETGTKVSALKQKKKQ